MPYMCKTIEAAIEDPEKQLITLAAIKQMALRVVACRKFLTESKDYLKLVKSMIWK